MLDHRNLRFHWQLYLNFWSQKKLFLHGIIRVDMEYRLRTNVVLRAACIEAYIAAWCRTSAARHAWLKPFRRCAFVPFVYFTSGFEERAFSRRRKHWHLFARRARRLLCDRVRVYLASDQSHSDSLRASLSVSRVSLGAL